MTLTHYNMVANATQAKRFDIKGLNWDIDAQLGVLPLFHIYVCQKPLPIPHPLAHADVLSRASPWS